MKTFVSWSGGKESAFSFYKAAQDPGISVSCLLNMVSEDGSQSRTHGVSSRLLGMQAEAMGVPIVQRRVAWGTYEKEFKRAVSEFKKEDIRAGVFGDIDLEAHRGWVERVCKETNIKPVFPLWQRKREEILREFIRSGFETVVVAVKTDVMGPEWVGRKIDEKFIEDLKLLDKVDLCGEAGEYHTLVTAGPVFRKRIEILRTRKTYRNRHCFLDILDYEIT